MSPINLNSQNKYALRLQGTIDESWLAWIGDVDATTIEISAERYETTLANVVMDQAGLVGLIRQLHGLGVILLAVDCKELIGDKL